MSPKRETLRLHSLPGKPGPDSRYAKLTRKVKQFGQRGFTVYLNISTNSGQFFRSSTNAIRRWIRPSKRKSQLTCPSFAA